MNSQKIIFKLIVAFIGLVGGTLPGYSTPAPAPDTSLDNYLVENSLITTSDDLYILGTASLLVGYSSYGDELVEPQPAKHKVA